MTFLLLFAVVNTAIGQENNQINKYAVSDSSTINKPRLYGLIGSSVVAGSGLSYGLYHAWYKQYPQSSFHLFDDGKEWNQMDKYGHVYSAYNQAETYYKLGKWTGLSKSQAIWTGVIAGTTIQSVIETFDGFSAQWGFSLWDMATNTAGVAAFAVQQHYWDDQIFRFKIYSFQRNYGADQLPIFVGQNGLEQSYEERINQLYGSNFLSRYLKDYNAQSIWISANLSSLLSAPSIPSYLNIAVGFGSENLLGGFENTWTFNDQRFDASEIGRQRQYFLSLDIDFDKIDTDIVWLNAVLSAANLFKVPAPTIEYNSSGEWLFHLILLQ